MYNNANATFSRRSLPRPYMARLVLCRFPQAMGQRDTYYDFLPRHLLLRLRRAGIIPVRL